MASASIIAALTEEGRRRIADMTISGRGFQVTQFVVGSGGADPSDPSVPLTPDTSVETLPSQTFGPVPVQSPSAGKTGTLISPFCPQYVGLLDYNQANGNISNVGLIATINFPPGDPLVGTDFLFAIGNRPTITKSDADQLQISITLQT